MLDGGVREGGGVGGGDVWGLWVAFHMRRDARRYALRTQYCTRSKSGQSCTPKRRSVGLGVRERGDQLIFPVRLVKPPVRSSGDDVPVWPERQT